ncbi:unnamed protein product [Orchesella dallaii]|uniref:Uncharacterized protein n=1 Tax=Orchesella dallaii TaxID=48710 RepID=A0ABP1QDM6_9HEXA
MACLLNPGTQCATNHHTCSSVEPPTLFSLTEPSSYSTTKTPSSTASATTSKLYYTGIVSVSSPVYDVPTVTTNHHSVGSVEPITVAPLTELSSYSTTETPPSSISVTTSKLNYAGSVYVPTPVNEVATVTTNHHTVSSVEPPTLTSLTELSSYSTTETQVPSYTARVITYKLNYAGIVSVPSPATEVATVTTNHHTIRSVKPLTLSSLTEVSSYSTTESPPSIATNITHVGTVPTTVISYLKTVRHINASDEGLSNLLLRSNSENKTNYETTTPCSFAQTSMFDKVNITFRCANGLLAYKDLKKKLSFLNILFEGQLFCFFVAAIGFYSQLPELIRQSSNHRLAILFAYLALDTIILILAAEFHYQVPTVVLD